VRGINDQFAIASSQIMLMTPLPKVDTAFSLLLQQERQNYDSNDCKALIVNANFRTNT